MWVTARDGAGRSVRRQPSAPKRNLGRDRGTAATLGGMTAIPATFRAYVAEKTGRGRDPAVERGVREFARGRPAAPARSRSGSAGRASTTRTGWRPGPTARSPGSARSSRASTWPARSSPRDDPAIAVGVGGARPRLRARRLAPRRLRRVPARAGRLGRAAGARPVAPRRDGHRDGRVHGGDVRRRARGARPDARPTGRCSSPARRGGVGGTALAILADRGYEVWAATGKPDEADRLRALGAAGILTRDEVTGEGRPLESERWAGAVDAVGAATLPYVLRTLKTGAARRRQRQRRRAAASRRRSSRSSCAASRCSGWTRSPCRSTGGGRSGTGSPTDLRPRALGEHVQEVTLDTLDAALDGIVAGAARGRWIVRIGG